MCLLWGLLSGMAEGIENRDKEKRNRELEEEMDNYCLDDWQKELVRKGEYDPWNFEEEDAEDEDDYYHEYDI